MQLQVNLVAEDILTQGTGDDGLHGMLGHDVQLQTVCVLAAVITVWTLLHLKPKRPSRHGQYFTIVKQIHSVFLDFETFKKFANVFN